MAKRSHRKGHGTGVRDYNLLAEINAMPRRDRLPGGERTVSTVDTPSGLSFSTVEDNRSDEKKFWDEHYADIQRRLADRRTADQTKTAALKRRAAKARAYGRPVDENGEVVTAAPAASAPQASEPPVAPAAPAAPSGPSNGRPQVKDAPEPKPLAPRNPRPPAQVAVVGTTGQFGGTGLASDSHVRVNGAPLDIRNTRAQTALAEAQAETLKADAIRATEYRKDVKSAAMTADVDRLHSRRVAEFQQEKNRQDLKDAQDQFREQQRAALMEKRYKNRSFRDADDWKNLGTLREGEKMLDEKTYDEKVGDLVKRAKRLRSAEGRAGLGHTDLQDMDMVFKTVGKLSTEKREDGSVKYGGNLTPAQIEALGKRIGGFESRAKASQDRAAAQAEAFNRRAADKYRQQYGLDGFSDEDVLDFHKKRAAKTANDALDRMMKYGATPKTGDGNLPDADAVRQYEKDWDTIRGNVNVTDVFNRAMKDQATKDKFMSDIADIGTGPGADIKQANLRRTAILNQMLKERQPQPEGAANPATGSLQQQPAAQQPAAQQPAAQQSAESLIPGLPPKKKKDEDVQAAMFAGTVLRPRVRR